MITAWLIKRYGPDVAGVIMRVGLVLLVVVFVISSYFAVRHYFTAALETQLKVQGAQANASAESGHDAVETVSNVADNAAETDRLTRENSNATDHAQGAAATVDPAVRAAGLRALCTRPSYRNTHASCVQ